MRNWRFNKKWIIIWNLPQSLTIKRNQLVSTRVFLVPSETWNVSRMKNGLIFQFIIISKRVLKEANSKTTGFLSWVETKVRKVLTTLLSSIEAPVSKTLRMERVRNEIIALATTGTTSLALLILLVVIEIKIIWNLKKMKSINISFKNCILETLIWMEALVIVSICLNHQPTNKTNLKKDSWLICKCR